MAAKSAIAARRCNVVARLDAMKARLREELGVTIEEQPITNRDPELAQVQQLENVAALLEGAMGGAAEPATPTGADSEAVVADEDEQGEGDAGEATDETSDAESTEETESQGETEEPDIFANIDKRAAQSLRDAGFDSLESIAGAKQSELVKLPYVTKKALARLQS